MAGEEGMTLKEAIATVENALRHGANPTAANYVWEYAIKPALLAEPEFEFGLRNPETGKVLIPSKNFAHVQGQHRRGHPSIELVYRRAASDWAVLPSSS